MTKKPTATEFHTNTANYGEVSWDPYLPTIDPNATIVEGLKKEIEELRDENAKLTEERDRNFKLYMEYLTGKVKYENAFKALLEEIKK